MKHLRWLAFLAAPAAFAQAPSPAPPAEALQSITGKEIGGHLRFLASDLMKGRDTASPESRLAGEYLAAHLFAAGAEPMGEADDKGNRTYFQAFPVEVITPMEEGTGLSLTVASGDSKKTIPLKLGEDFIFLPRGVDGGEVEAPVVFAGYGRDDEAKKVNDYDGLDVKGKCVLVYAGEPEEGERPRPSNPFAKAEPARKRGALGVLIMTAPGKELPANRPATPPRNMGFGRTMMTLGTGPAGNIPTITINPSARDTVAEALSLAADTKPQLLADGNVKARFSYAQKKDAKGDRNVLGYFPGSDPEKRKEIIIYSAHYDHVGVGADGQIYNGSDDNASGTSTLLELAEAYGKAPRPARSVAFLWVSGEEKGLWGSQWYSNHMTVPEGYKIVADINIDMVSRNDPTKVGITPSPKHKDYNTLIPAAQAACEAEGMEAQFNADSYYARTDSYNFAAKGIPIIFFFTGEHADYHKPTDDYEKADIEKAARIGRTAFRLGWQAAQADEAPHKIQAEPAKEEAKP
ncbi:MAG: M20/M25/M40 family metallo-hydrolase [Isosphaeraceae bacterium]